MPSYSIHIILGIIHNLMLVLNRCYVWLFATPWTVAQGFPGGLTGKESTFNAGDTGRHEFNPQVRKIPWRRAWQPTAIFLPRKSHGQKSLVGYSPWGSQKFRHNWSDWAHRFEQTVDLQAPPSMGFPRQEYWSGLPFPPPGDLPDPGIEPTFPALTGRFFTTEPPW